MRNSLSLPSLDCVLFVRVQFPRALSHYQSVQYISSFTTTNLSPIPFSSPSHILYIFPSSRFHYSSLSKSTPISKHPTPSLLHQERICSSSHPSKSRHLLSQRLLLLLLRVITSILLLQLCLRLGVHQERIGSSASLSIRRLRELLLLRWESGHEGRWHSVERIRGGRGTLLLLRLSELRARRLKFVRIRCGGE